MLLYTNAISEPILCASSCRLFNTNYTNLFVSLRTIRSFCNFLSKSSKSFCIYLYFLFRKFATNKILYSNIYTTRCNVTQFICIWKLLYMFRVVSPPIIRSTHNCIYRIWYLSNCKCYLPLSWKSWNCKAVPTLPR